MTGICPICSRGFMEEANYASTLCASCKAEYRDYQDYFHDRIGKLETERREVLAGYRGHVLVPALTSEERGEIADCRHCHSLGIPVSGNKLNALLRIIESRLPAPASTPAKVRTPRELREAFIATNDDCAQDNIVDELVERLERAENPLRLVAKAADELELIAANTASFDLMHSDVRQLIAKLRAEGGANV